jgi:hypothetical protein
MSKRRYWSDHHPRGREPNSLKATRADRDADASERGWDPAWQLSDLVCYLINLADDLQSVRHGNASRSRIGPPGWTLPQAEIAYGFTQVEAADRPRLRLRPIRRREQGALM